MYHLNLPPMNFQERYHRWTFQWSQHISSDGDWTWCLERQAGTSHHSKYWKNEENLQNTCSGWRTFEVSWFQRKYTKFMRKLGRFYNFPFKFWWLIRSLLKESCECLLSNTISNFVEQSLYFETTVYCTNIDGLMDLTYFCFSFWSYYMYNDHQ